MSVETKGLTLLEATHNLNVKENVYISGSLFVSSIFCFKATAGEQIEKNDAVFLNSNGKIYKTNPASINSSIFAGFSNSSINIEQETYVRSGIGQIVTEFLNLSTGSRYFLSESIGKISPAPPTTKGTVVSQVGIAKSNFELLIFPHLFIIN